MAAQTSAKQLGTIRASRGIMGSRTVIMSLFLTGVLSACDTPSKPHRTFTPLPAANKPAPPPTQTVVQSAPPTVVRLPSPKVEPPPPIVTNTSPKIDLKAERQSLWEADIAFAAASREQGAARAFYEYLAPDALSLPMGELPVRGRDAIRVQILTTMRGSLSWTPEYAEVSQSADLGYTWGTYVFHSEADEERSQTLFGKYLTVWKKQSDGSWKVIVDTGNESPPPERRR
jgi:ketosteroid isomerase-like protein